MNAPTVSSEQVGAAKEPWQPKKLAEVTMQLWREGKIAGLFLSSSVSKDPDYVTEMQLVVLRIFRKAGYFGYIHLRIMPGTTFILFKGVVELADRGREPCGSQ